MTPTDALSSIFQRFDAHLFTTSSQFLHSHWALGTYLMHGSYNLVAGVIEHMMR